MSTRSSRKQSKQTTVTKSSSVSSSQSTSAAETPGPSTPQASTSFTSPRRGQRSPSPNVTTRTQEKHELAHLNDRLATYIDKVRSLETDNARLTKLVRTHEETTTREVTNIKGLYENELQDARRVLDDVSKQRAQLKVENEKLVAENKDLLAKNLGQENELKDAKRQKLAAEAQVNDLQARLNDAVNQRKHWEAEYNKARKELEDLKKQLATLKKQHENEMVQRVDLSNRMQSIKEELQFKTSLHQQQLEEQQVRSRTEIEEVDGRIQEEYESRLRDVLQQMREENDEAIARAREETEALFASKIAHLRDAAGRTDKAAESSRSELKNIRQRNAELSSQVTQLSSQNAAYLARIADLEDRINRMEEENAEAVAALNQEIQRLRDALEDQVVEHRDLLDVKIQLDNEIASYRRMLESEETRLNISTEEGGTPGRSFRRTPGMSSKKRKRGQDDLGQSYFQSSASAAYTQRSSAKGSVEVQETDTEGKFVKLVNNSDKDQSLGGWQLRHTAGDEETVYKFHRSTNLKSQADVTVWSAGQGETHDPSSGVMVMKSQRWFTGDKMLTELIDPQGEVQATRELEKSQMTTTFSRAMTSGTPGQLDDVEGDPQDKCSIM